MIIPTNELSSDVLQAIIKEFVLREGTDYGSYEVNLEEKIAQVKLQLAQKTAFLVYSELHETVNIIPAEEMGNIDIEQES